MTDYNPTRAFPLGTRLSHQRPYGRFNTLAAWLRWARNKPNRRINVRDQRSQYTLNAARVLVLSLIVGRTRMSAKMAKADLVSEADLEGLAKFAMTVTLYKMSAAEGWFLQELENNRAARLTLGDRDHRRYLYDIWKQMQIEASQAAMSPKKEAPSSGATGAQSRRNV
jgi:hypothetical protein